MPGNKGVRYVYSPKHISDILAKVRETGRPDKLTLAYVRDTWLLKDNNLSAVLILLEDMGFVDQAGTPTDQYAAYQNDELSKQVLADGIKAAYSELFKAYPDANAKDKAFLRGYFKQKTGAEKDVLDKVVSTFSALCAQADFSPQGEKSAVGAAAPLVGRQPTTQGTILPISMNIQIVIPSDASEEQYDKIFSSIRKFLAK